jgi:SEC-C motif
MSPQYKVGRNDRCPCLTGRKFKHCCLGKVDWETIIREKRDYRPYLSVRGRNFYFAESISDALQLNKLGDTRNLKNYKAAFTADAVRKINEAILDIWPPGIDIGEVLRREAGDVSGLYIGDYSTKYITSAILRHSIYANRILVIDPFVYPTAVRDEYNPIINPEQHRTQTLRTVNLWFALLPWIQAGIVSVIRPPSDFDHRLNWDLMTEQMKKFAESPELKSASNESVDEMDARHRKELSEKLLLLGAPDDYLKHKFEQLKLDKSGTTFEEFIAEIQDQRDRDPDFLEPMSAGGEGQLLMMSTGTSYACAKLTASLTDSYLFTDISSKWKEMELDREAHSAENKVWAPFAKALQEAKLKYLNCLRPQHALQLRDEGRLESLRTFLRKVWKTASTDDQFDDANAILLTEELGDEVRKAEQEWKKIDRDLAKIVKAEAVTGLLAAGPMLAAGHALFLAAALGVAGVGTLASSTMKRRSFPDRFPAAFFMKIESQSK